MAPLMPPLFKPHPLPDDSLAANSPKNVTNAKIIELIAKVIPEYGNSLISEYGNGKFFSNQSTSAAIFASHIKVYPLTAMTQSIIPIRISFVVLFINFPPHV
jgi:hypothetical protein